MSLPFEKTPRVTLSCQLVPAGYREYAYGLLAGTLRTYSKTLSNPFTTGEQL